uniref:ABC-type xenobiotic transporter n=1 Tax=Glossina austeni TaxID=7395 RepID=A0A1A9USS9_GLOAU
MHLNRIGSEKIKKSENILTHTGNFKGLKNESPTQTAKQFSYFQLFRYATVAERFLIFLAIILASLSAVNVPFCVAIYGEFTSLLIDRTVGVGTSSATFFLPIFGGGKILTNATHDENMQAIKVDGWAFLLGSVVGSALQLLTIAISVNILNKSALKQISRVRKLFLESILRQDMSWFDTNSGNNFAGKMAEDLDKMKEGIGEKIGIFTYLIVTFVLGIAVSFFYGWKLTLVMLLCCPFIVLSTALVAKIQSSLTEKELKAYSNAGAVAEEVFSGLRTVLAFGGEKKEVQRFTNLLKPAEDMGRKRGLYSGIGGCIMWFIIYSGYALAMWYGVNLVLSDRLEEHKSYTPAVLVIVLFGIIIGAQSIGFASPHIEAFGTAKGAAQSVFTTIDRKSYIDPLSDEGAKPSAVRGQISFENLYFRYPARADVKILQGFSLEVNAGETVALVGASGCGKSTTLQLFQRFYDPLSGDVKLDGRNIRDLNVAWLRAQIGVVGQEPVLFATTIEENIRYGKPTATKEEIKQAARIANCHDFIVKLPKGYETMVGERGAQMSGGQKQRIAIARAIINDPKILLLDEATSALDPTSEKKVQIALEEASRGRTTLVVSHRLSTITNADKIVFVKDGVVAEQGTHEQLMAKGGLYNQLVNITKTSEELDDDDDEQQQADIEAKINNNEPEEEEEEEETDEEEEEDKESTAATEAYDNGGFTLERGVSDVRESEKRKRKKSKKSKKRVKKEEEKKYEVSFSRIMKLNAPEWPYIALGCVAAALHGATFPAWAIFFGDFFAIMSNADNAYVQSEATFLSYLFMAIGVVAGLGTFVQTFMFNTAGAKMTSRLRRDTFETLLKQEAAYFDHSSNSVGALCSRLAADCSNVQGATGTRIGMMLQCLSTLLVGIAVAFVYSWNLTLVTIVLVPFICLSIFLESRYMESSSLTEKAAFESASRIAVEAIANVRTVTSLGQERYVLQRYSSQIDLVHKSCVKKLRFRGFVYGLGQSAPFFAYGISLFYGAILVANGLPYENVIKVAESLLFGSWMLGQALAFSPNVGAGVYSAGRLFKLFDRLPAQYIPKIRPFNTAEKSEGNIVYENVSFEYPTRQGIPILRNFNLEIQKGSTVALVGPSGSGKSTCVQLLLRYYDPIKGSINLSGTPTTDFTLETLRSKLSLVSQEPVLFDRSIADNIAYGNNCRDPMPMTEIIDAAKKANIHDFITSLPQGYETLLGSKGAQLSGGQKQRIAIARAMVRNPKILILDEATSALDMESEKVVQQALEVARSGRTCVTIAHRLTTVRDADVICVLKKGVIVEKGTHDELMNLKRIYYKLYIMQQVT